jgi:hypothetical protein
MTTETIEITTILPLDVFRRQADVMEAQFEIAAIHVELGGDTVARTYAGLMFRDWFEKQEQSWSEFLGWASYHGDDAWIISDAWEALNTDVHLTWVFYPAMEGHADLAMLFKLTFGGR